MSEANTAPDTEAEAQELGEIAPEDVDNDEAVGDKPSDPEPEPEPEPEPDPEPEPEPEEDLLEAFRNSGPDYQVAYLDRLVDEKGRHDLRPTRDALDQFVGCLDTDGRRKGLPEFLETYEEARVMSMGALKRVIDDKPDDDNTRMVRSALNRVLKSLPEK